MGAMEKWEKGIVGDDTLFVFLCDDLFLLEASFLKPFSP